MQRDSAVGRHGPGRGGPDHQRDWAVDRRVAELRAHRVAVYRVEHDVDRGRGFVIVFDFRFRQRRAAVQTPVHRLRALVQMAVADNFAQRADDIGFGLEVHRQIGTIPVAQHAEADKVRLLPFHLLGGVFAARFAEFGRRDFFARLADHLLDLMLDRQTVTVPARHVRRIEARHAFRLNDNVFQNLVN